MNDHRELIFFFIQAEDGIRDLVRSRGLGDVYKRQKLRSIPRGIPPRMGGFAELANLKSTPDLPFGLTSRHKADRRAANPVPFRARP